jgi:hypothetical protein
MREAQLYHDPPEYYSQGRFLSIQLDVPPLPEGYNSWRDTEQMVQVWPLACLGVCSLVLCVLCVLHVLRVVCAAWMALVHLP